MLYIDNGDSLIQTPPFIDGIRDSSFNLKERGVCFGFFWWENSVRKFDGIFFSSVSDIDRKNVYTESTYVLKKLFL